MTENMYNEIAGMLFGNYSEGPTLINPEGLLSENDLLEIAMAIHCPGVSEWVHNSVPFDLSSALTASFHEDYLQVIDIQKLDLSSLASRLIQAQSRICTKAIPLCFRKKVAFSRSFGIDNLRLEAELKNNGKQLELSFRSSNAYDGNLEVWKMGELWQSIPLGKSMTVDLSLSPKCQYAVRLSTQTEGISVIALPGEFQFKDWLASALFNIYAGDFSEACRILRAKLGRSAQAEGVIPRLVSIIQAISALTKTVNGVLVPIPATRSVSSMDHSDKVKALAPFWEGICDVWPEIERIDHPWGRQHHASNNEGLPPLNEAAFDLARNAINIANGHAADTEATDPAVEDSRAAQGQTALSGWLALANGSYEEALGHFSSLPKSDSDPFKAHEAVSLARHLSLVRSGMPKEVIEESNDRFWKKIFAGV